MSQATLLCMALLIAAGSTAAQAPEGRLYTPGPFERLVLSGSAKVKLIQGDHDQIFIAGNADVQKSVEVQLRGDRLLVRPAGDWKFWNSSRLEIEVLVRQLNQLVLSGASDLHAPGPFKADKLAITISGAGLARFDELTADQLRFGISGAGEGQLRGRVAALTLNVSGKGKLQAEQLRTQSAAVSISGVGSASLWTTDALSISVSGIGTVDYWGRPEVSRVSSGMATVNALGERPPAFPTQGSPSQ
jgi:Putative auto-transporter adhesin, head GIN domain